MGDKTAIAWCDHTFNIAWGCSKVSPGCAHCYAETLSHRRGFDVWGRGKDRRTFGAAHWREPVRWNKRALGGEAGVIGAGWPHLVFCSSMCDVFEDHPTIDRERTKLWEVIRETPGLDWLLLTKRPARICKCLPIDWGGGWDNVWLGTSIESNDYAARADTLARIPAAVRFISAEPALGPLHNVPLRGIHWVIYGGESGPGFRADNADWARSLRDRCRAGGVAFFYKQGSAIRPGSAPELDGDRIQEFPVNQILPRVSLTVPTGSGSLSKLVHPGSPSGEGCVGTNDPALWQHLLWFDGQVWSAELKDDLLAHICTFEELRSHFEHWRGTGKSPWKRVDLTKLKTL